MAILYMSKILIIDDDPHIRYNIEQILELYNYQTLTASDGYMGLHLAKKHLPDLIVCDVVMPKIDGYGVLSSLRQHEQNPNVPFIFLTGKSDRSDFRVGMEFGADDYLIKPFTPNELLRAIATQLEKKSIFQSQSQTQLNNLRQNISRAIPHEMNTALNGILGFSQLLIFEESLSPEGLEMTESIYKSAKRLHHLVKNYLLYINLELIAHNPEQLKAWRAKTTTCCTENLITEVARQIATEFERSPDLSVEIENITLQISFDHLKKIASEIINNAFKFSPTQSSVSILGSVVQNHFNLFVTNYGRGMKPEQIANTGAFMQFERQVYEQQGSGLGLALTKQIVELYGGQLHIDSIPDEQTTIHIILPG